MDHDTKHITGVLAGLPSPDVDKRRQKLHSSPEPRGRLWFGHSRNPLDSKALFTLGDYIGGSKLLRPRSGPS